MKLNKLIFYLFTLCLIVTENSAQNSLDRFENKVVLITGGTGFIGKALINEIIKYNPHKIIVFSRDEVKHAKLLEHFKNNEKIISILGDVRNFDSIFSACKNVDIVIHAAALKRIDILEYNILESINTNLQGTINVARACVENKVKTALLVSTDKACSPINTYGACKFISEKIFTNGFFNQTETQFIVVRYGNVLQSTGSVIPYFCEKIRNKQAIPLTHQDMTRFFITKEQAIEHIFKALKYGCGGEIFIPNLPAFKIVDLIYALQALLKQESEISIIGLRPGEKIHEIMINNSEIPRTYAFDDMFVIVPSIGKNKTETLYAKYGQLLQEESFSEYSSNSSLLSIEDLYLFLDKNKIFLKKSFNKKKFNFFDL